MQRQPFEFGETARAGRHRLQRVVADRDDVRALDEVVHAERREESRAAAGGENVIRAGDVVAGPNHVLRSEEHTSELQSHLNLLCRPLLEKKKTNKATRSKQ